MIKSLIQLDIQMILDSSLYVVGRYRRCEVVANPLVKHTGNCGVSPPFVFVPNLDPYQRQLIDADPRLDLRKFGIELVPSTEVPGSEG